MVSTPSPSLACGLYLPSTSIHTIIPSVPPSPRSLARFLCFPLFMLSRLSYLTVSDRRRNTLTSAQNRSESLCAGLWAPCRVFWAWFGVALRLIPVRNRRYPAGSLKVFPGLFSSAELWLSAPVLHLCLVFCAAVCICASLFSVSTTGFCPGEMTESGER